MKHKTVYFIAFLFSAFLGMVMTDMDHILSCRYLHSFYIVLFLVGLLIGYLINLWGKAK